MRARSLSNHVAKTTATDKRCSKREGDDRTDGLPVPRRYWSALTIWLAIAISVLDGSIANVALPAIARDLAAPPADAVWVINAYQLTIVVSLLPMAALGEVVGFRRVFQCGVVLFTLASLGCTLAHSLPAIRAHYYPVNGRGDDER